MKFSEMISHFQQGKGSAKSHMKNLIEMAAVDGNFEEVEMKLLSKLATKNGISESQLQDIRKNSAGIEFEIPKDKKEKFHQLYDLVHMMSVDNNVHRDEQNLCTLFAIKFGYQRTHINDLLDAVRLNIKNGQSQDETMKRVEFMLN